MKTTKKLNHDSVWVKVVNTDGADIKVRWSRVGFSISASRKVDSKVIDTLKVLTKIEGADTIGIAADRVEGYFKTLKAF